MIRGALGSLRNWETPGLSAAVRPEHSVALTQNGRARSTGTANVHENTFLREVWNTLITLSDVGIGP